MDIFNAYRHSVRYILNPLRLIKISETGNMHYVDHQEEKYVTRNNLNS